MSKVKSVYSIWIWMFEIFLPVEYYWYKHFRIPQPQYIEDLIYIHDGDQVKVSIHKKIKCNRYVQGKSISMVEEEAQNMDWKGSLLHLPYLQD